MTFDRPYSRAISFETARAEIKRCAGTHFDPAVVDTFLTIPLQTFSSIRPSSLQDTTPPTPRPRRCAPPSAASGSTLDLPSASECEPRGSALHDDRAVTSARQSLGGRPRRLAVGIRAHAHAEEDVAPDLGLGDRRDVTIPGQGLAQALGPRPAGEGADLDGEPSGGPGARR